MKSLKKLNFNRNLDGSKIKYTKKVVQDDPIGFIDLDDENVLFLYPSDDFWSNSSHSLKLY